MALVAYDYSSSDDSDQEDEEQPKPTTLQAAESHKHHLNHTEVKHDEAEAPEPSIHLPLPAPKATNNGLPFEEEDDEFLHKRAIPEPLPKSGKPKTKNGKVQITVPSLKDFQDDDKPKPKPSIGAELPRRATGLLAMLPKPKTAMFSAGPTSSQASAPTKAQPIAKRLVPDSVAMRPRTVQKTVKKVEIRSDAVDSENSDDEEKVDFFSLTAQDKLPEISANEINAMVAKRAARMAEVAKQFSEPEPVENEPEVSGLQSAEYVSENEADLANERALASLIGGNKAKRARVEEVNIIDISSADIVPTKEDFMRRKLQEETGYVPTGQLTGDWSCTSKRKSHITYLASKAQENAQELEAMWSANRQSRRQTQSKYGF